MWRRIVAKHGGFTSKVVFETDREEEAFAEEIRLIKEHGKRSNGTGRLSNLTDGGEGCAGYVPPPETKEKLSRANLGHQVTPETRAKIRAALLGRKKSPETVRAISEACAKAKGVPIVHLPSGHVFRTIRDAAKGVGLTEGVLYFHFNGRRVSAEALEKLEGLRRIEQKAA